MSYKVFGPHMAVLYAKSSSQSELRSLGHYFNPTETLEHKLGLAGASYELVQCVPKIVEYLRPVFSSSTEHEAKIQGILLDYLHKRGDVIVYGEPCADRNKRMPTVSFNVQGWDPRTLVETVEKDTPFGFRWGHFYAKRLCDDILSCGENGVARVSMVHYNTEEEVRGLIEAFEKVLGSSV